ncbi:hypothetical protein FRC07_007852 [Ceratobasidium sp. 392]|nr:hypothetical protein FRC07_007852 [Ceratobasidium sp. 392]
MPTLAGWYLSSETCLTWLKPRSPSLCERKPRAGAGAALSWAIEQDLKAKGFGKHVDLHFVSSPEPEGTEDGRSGWGLMLVRRSSAEKVYISRETDPAGFDVIGREIINQNFGLELPEWSVVWWEMKDGRMVSEFLHPAV